jgi:hypothetical protein
MGKGEKAIWTLLMVVLVLLELRTLYLDRDEHDQEQALARCEQLQSFQQIATTLGTAISTSQTQFAETMRGVGKVFDKTEQAADLAGEGVMGMTGADSYLLIFPHGTLSKSPQDEGKFILLPSVLGKHIVWDAEISMREGPVDQSFYSSPLENFQLKPVSSTHLAGFGKFIQPSKTGTTTYGFQISTRGPSEIENLQVRFNSDKALWEFQYWLYEEKPAKIPVPPVLIKHLDWSAIPYPELR